MGVNQDFFGWRGQILRVDLTTGKISKEPSIERVRKFVGGMGLGAKIMWDENCDQRTDYGNSRT